MRRGARLSALPGWQQWAILGVATLICAIPLGLIRLPAAFLLGAMIAGVVVRIAGAGLVLRRWARSVPEALLGCLVGSSISGPALAIFADNALMFLGIGVLVIGASTLLGWILHRMRLYPGTTAVWGLSPGAAPVMTLMSAEFGADERLVAFMQYLRVLMVAAIAPVIAHLVGTPGGSMIAGTIPGGPLDIVLSLALAGVGLGLAHLLPFPGGMMLVAMALSAVAQSSGLIAVTLPAPLMTAAYIALGWGVGLNFTMPVLRHALATLPQTFVAMLLLIGFCAGIGAILTLVDGVDPLTAYLATSPGGLSSVAVIAATSQVDLAFVISMQTLRFIMVLSLGPAISRYIATRAA